jgi:hypothetical protein
MKFIFLVGVYYYWKFNGHQFNERLRYADSSVQSARGDNVYTGHWSVPNRWTVHGDVWVCVSKVYDRTTTFCKTDGAMATGSRVAETKNSQTTDTHSETLPRDSMAASR